MSNPKLFTATPRMVGGMKIRTIEPLPKEEMRQSLIDNYPEFIERHKVEPDMSNIKKAVKTAQNRHRYVPDEAYWLILLDGEPETQFDEKYKSVEMDLYAVNLNPWRLSDECQGRHALSPEVQMMATDSLFRNGDRPDFDGKKTDFSLVMRHIESKDLDMRVIKYAIDTIGLDAIGERYFPEKQRNEINKYLEAKQTDLTLTDADLEFAKEQIAGLEM